MPDACPVTPGIPEEYFFCLEDGEVIDEGTVVVLWMDLHALNTRKKHLADGKQKRTNKNGNLHARQHRSVASR